MARYRKVDPRIWSDEKFIVLSRTAKLVFLFLLTHPSLLPVGAMRAVKPSLAHELMIEGEVFDEAFEEVLGQGFVLYDAKAFCLAFPNFLKYNPPESPNVARAMAKAFHYIPDCDLKLQIQQQTQGFLQAFGEAFIKAFNEAFEKPKPYPKPKPKPSAKPSESLQEFVPSQTLPLKSHEPITNNQEPSASLPQAFEKPSAKAQSSAWPYDPLLEDRNRPGHRKLCDDPGCNSFASHVSDQHVFCQTHYTAILQSPDAAWLQNLTVDPTYRSLNVRVQLQRAKIFLQSHPNQPYTRDFFTQWLNDALKQQTNKETPTPSQLIETLTEQDI